MRTTTASAFPSVAVETRDALRVQELGDRLEAVAGGVELEDPPDYRGLGLEDF
jgi:hypothetical protein